MLLAGWVPAERDIEILPPAGPTDVQVATVNPTPVGSFVVLSDGGIDVRFGDGRQQGLVRPDLELIGMPRVVAAS